MLNRTVIIISIISLFADIASEMIYPVIPVYLDQVGFSVLMIGILEGIAEFTAGVSKGYFGKLSDEKGLRLPFIKTGYFLSAVSKPMMVIFTVPAWIFLARTTDRLGKGVRTAARDALLSENAAPGTKARVFGFHRSLDTFGAAIGPILALIFLFYFPGKIEWLFYFAFVPGIVAVLLIFLLRERRQRSSTLSQGGFFSFLRYWPASTAEYRKLVPALLLFTLFNSSDIFLLLRTSEIARENGFRIPGVDFDYQQITILAYIFYNLVFAIFSYPFGSLADRFGFRNMLCTGLFFFFIVYAGFSIASDIVVVFFLFAVYGLYSAATDGLIKAWITNLSHGRDTATAVGFFTSAQSICSLAASTLAGILWVTQGSSFIFMISAVVSLIVCLYFLIILRTKK